MRKTCDVKVCSLRTCVIVVVDELMYGRHGARHRRLDGVHVAQTDGGEVELTLVLHLDDDVDLEAQVAGDDEHQVGHQAQHHQQRNHAPH